MKEPSTLVFGEGGKGGQSKACSEDLDNKAELTAAVMRPKEQQVPQTAHKILRTTLEFFCEQWGRSYKQSRITRTGCTEVLTFK